MKDSFTLERPIAFLPGTVSKKFVCIYKNDACLEVLVFDSNSKHSQAPLQQPLSSIILTSPWAVQRLIHDDLISVIGQLENMTDDEFNSKAIPYGVWPFNYVIDRTAVVTRLKQQADANYSPPWDTKRPTTDTPQ